MLNARLLLVVAFSMFTGAVPAPVDYAATMSGANEVPPNASPATGATTVTLDTAAHTLRVVASFAGLTGTSTASHIHCCAPPGTSAGIATTTPTFVATPLGVTSGNFDTGNLDTTAASTWNPTFVTANGGTTAGAEAALAAALNIGQAYLNVHSTAFPGGEIRGNLLAGAPVPVISVPIVAGLALVLMLLGWWLLRRRESATPTLA